MTKKQLLAEQLSPIITRRKEVEAFLIANSNLPGPRANLECCFAFAECCNDYAMCADWLKITEEIADVNNPKSFLPFCALVCMGKIYTTSKDKRIIDHLKLAANDGRWRIREAVAFGFQNIGEDDFEGLAAIFSKWLPKANNREKRALLVTLAHPPMLTQHTAAFCFTVADTILQKMDRTTDFDILRKGLEFTISVFAAAHPVAGFAFIRKWIGKDHTIDRIMKTNLEKNRISREFPAEVGELMGILKSAGL